MSHDHKADQDRAAAQNSFTDFTRTADDLPEGDGLLSRMVNGTLRAVARQSPYAPAVQHSTDFGGTDLGLNQLLDLVEQTDPADLESSGTALWDARDAIRAAADELAGHIDNVHWVGASGDAFRDWGGTLVGKTHLLSDFAGGAGDQLSAAAEGLASVRGAMPSRDTQANRKRPHEFTDAEKAANKDDYAAAVRVEKDRQEAINQMNRLASYYAVSKQQLAALRGPTFDPMPDVGVPEPVRREHRNVPTGATPDGTAGSGPATVPPHHETGAPADHAAGRVAADSPTSVRHVTEPAPATTPPAVPVGTTPVGTDIDSVGTLPPPVTSSPPVHTPPATGSPVPSGGHSSMFEGGLGISPPPGTSGRGAGGSGRFRTPAYAQGRTTTSGPNAPAGGRSQARGLTNQPGRATPTGQPIGNATQAGAKPATTSMGRGVTGGTPRAGGTAGPRATGGPATGAGRANGVVGGRPTTTPGVSSKGSGSRIPRGTVIGAEGTAGPRPSAGRSGTRGVLGTPEGAPRPRTAAPAPRSGGGAAEPVSGTPTTRNSLARAQRNGMTRGGAGLVRGPGSGRKGDDETEAEDAPRPEHVVEETENQLPTKPRRDVPPVVN
ncbi:hypothetical protein ACF061_36680 [Streptomyces sp. NPDC015220]|uniref:hypothetical protein n=1 Tax=Streptomyces sp. NPDC015220 TaxID=3364947 RepID=UPI00370352E8